MAQRRLEQVTRITRLITGDSLTEYAWRPASETEGDPVVIVWTPTEIAPTDFVPWTMNSSFYGTNKAAGVGRWAVCPTCQEEFPISEMVLVSGRYYCTKNGDAKEKQSDS